MKQLSIPMVAEPAECYEFLISSCNEAAYKFLVEQYISNDRTILTGPRVSGKTKLSKLWCADGLYLNCEYDQLDCRSVNGYSRVVLDNFHLGNDVELFHILNRCSNYGIDLLLISNERHYCKLPDLVSRLNASFPLQIFPPDREFCLLVVQELCIVNRIKIKPTTLDYIKYNIDFNDFVDLWKFRVQLKIACDENNNILDTGIFKKVYDNWRRM